MIEKEAKFKFDGDLGLLEKVSTNLVKDVYFEMECDKVLRLRKEGSKCYIAYKGAREKHDSLIIREEIETEVNDFDIFMKIILGLGFKVSARVEKERSEFKHKDFVGTKILLDKYLLSAVFWK